MDDILVEAENTQLEHYIFQSIVTKPVSYILKCKLENAPCVSQGNKS